MKNPAILIPAMLFLHKEPQYVFLPLQRNLCLLQYVIHSRYLVFRKQPVRPWVARPPSTKGDFYPFIQYYTKYSMTIFKNMVLMSDQMNVQRMRSREC